MLHEKHPTRLTFLALSILCAVVITTRAETQKFTTARVQKVLAAAVAKAEEIGVPMGIAVVDAGANLVGFIKMDGAFIHTHYTAQAKPIPPPRYIGPRTRAAYPLLTAPIPTMRLDETTLKKCLPPGVCARR